MIIILLILTKNKKDWIFCLTCYRDDLTSVILGVTRAQTFKNIFHPLPIRVDQLSLFLLFPEVAVSKQSLHLIGLFAP